MNQLNPITYDELLDRVELQMHEIGSSEFDTSGFLCDGLYVRSIYIPAGSYLTSLVHKSDHPFILSTGSIRIFTQDGGEQVLNAPYIDITPAGTRRFAYAITNCLWTTIHKVNGRTEEDIRKEVILERVNTLIKELQ